MLKDDIKTILVDEKEIQRLCKELGEKISKDYVGKDLVIIGLLKGCEPFMSDLIKNINVPVRIDYMNISSYEGAESSGFVVIKKDIEIPIAGRDVIVVDDIIDTGGTLHSVLHLFNKRGARSVEACVLLDKPEGRKVKVDVKYIGTSIPKEFVVGYGLDFNELYRNLPFIGALKEEVYRKKN